MATQNENRDELTGLWNRKYAVEKLEAAVKAGTQVALLLIDIDRMKSVNDVYGHDFGDQKLIEIAREMEASGGKSSLVSRFGGDEFIVILFESSLEEARQVAEIIRAQRKPMSIKLEEKEVEALTLSIGVTHFPTHVSNSRFQRPKFARSRRFSGLEGQGRRKTGRTLARWDAVYRAQSRDGDWRLSR